MGQHDKLDLANRIPATFEAKGWALYRAPQPGHPQRDLPQLISSGRSTCLEVDIGYCVLPLAQRPNDPDDVIRHIQYARERNQLPTYHQADTRSGQLAWIVLRDKSLDIELVDQGPRCTFKLADALAAIRHRVTNYNIHYFESIDELRTVIGRRYTDPLTAGREHRGPRWQLVHPHPQAVSFELYPADPSPLLFRGQTTRYRPCMPTIARGFPVATAAAHQLGRAHQAALILNLARTAWFNQNLRETPAMTWMSQQRVVFDETAVAQHYELPTGYVDLSESLDVATFFACCRFNHDHSSWEPVAEGQGVVYEIDRTVLGPQSALKPIALQPFPRPSEQWGWVHELYLGEDFDALPYVRKMIFEHDYEDAKKILRRFRHGCTLFPPDPLADLANEIKDSQALPLSTLTQVAADLRNDPFGLPGTTDDEMVQLIERHCGVSCSSNLDPLRPLDSLRTRLESNWASSKADFPPPAGLQLVRTVRNT